MHKKVFHVNEKKLMLHKKSISCREKEDDAAQKNILCSKKLLNFFRNGTPYQSTTYIADFTSMACNAVVISTMTSAAKR